MIKLEMNLHYGNLKVVEFIMTRQHGTFKEAEANVKASLHGLSHPSEPVNGQFHKRD